MTTTSTHRRPHVVRAVQRTVAAVMFGVLTIAFVLEPAWVESATGASPDGGSGGFELALALVAGVATLMTSVGAGRAWRRVLAAGG